MGRDSFITKTNEFEEGFLELWGGIPALLRLTSLERDSYSAVEGFLLKYD